MKVNKIRMRETVISYAFLAPVLFFFVIFVLAPMIMGFITSFFNYSMTKFEFVGLDNYVRMFKDPVFMKSLINTVILVIGSVPVVVLFSLFVASQTYHQNAIARSFYRFVFFLPVVTGSVAVTVVWKWIYDPLSGILNFVLKSSHIISQNISWLGDKNWALMAIMIILLTTSVGQPIILISQPWEISTIHWWKQLGLTVRLNCKFSGRLNGLVSFQQHFISQSLQQSTHSSVSP